MCYQPLTLPNNRIDYNYYHPFAQTVPCGHCLDCQRMRQDDWFVRLYYEFKRNPQGCVLFPTFTYNDRCLPVVDLSDPRFDVVPGADKRPLVSCKSFDKVGFQNLLKKFRMKLDREFDLKCRYFVVTEYGSDDEKTHRPHYHCK